MGHKVHPVGYRVGFNKPWLAKWYADRDYASLLQEDMRIRRLVGSHPRREAVIRLQPFERQCRGEQFRIRRRHEQLLAVPFEDHLAGGHSDDANSPTRLPGGGRAGEQFLDSFAEIRCGQPVRAQQQRDRTTTNHTLLDDVHSDTLPVQPVRQDLRSPQSRSIPCHLTLENAGRSEATPRRAGHAPPPPHYVRR